LGVLVERLDSLDQKLRALTKDHSSARAELERSQTHMVETSSSRQRRDRMLGYLTAAAVLLSAGALAISLLM